MRYSAGSGIFYRLLLIDEAGLLLVDESGNTMLG